VGQELYDIILNPAKTELQQQKAQTLLWSLDGTLRYVPMAALWDGENYLNERYQNVQFTRADPKRMTAQVSSTWKGVGFDNSQEIYAGGSLIVPAIRFSSLPGVTLELNYLFGLDSSTKAVLQGNVFIDKKLYQDGRLRRDEGAPCCRSYLFPFQILTRKGLGFVFSSG